jgi:hypothetical protein
MEREEEFTIEKETFGNYRFREVPRANQPPMIGTIYVKKYIFATKPISIKVKVTVPDVVVPTTHS